MNLQTVDDSFNRTPISFMQRVLLELEQLNKGFDAKFRIGSWVRQETPEEDQRTHQPKRCEYKNKDEENGLNTLNYKKWLFLRYFALMPLWKVWIHFFPPSVMVE